MDWTTDVVQKQREKGSFFWEKRDFFVHILKIQVF